jgi:hypothetical protein
VRERRREREAAETRSAELNVTPMDGCIAWIRTYFQDLSLDTRDLPGCAFLRGRPLAAGRGEALLDACGASASSVGAAGGLADGGRSRRAGRSRATLRCQSETPALRPSRTLEATIVRNTTWRSCPATLTLPGQKPGTSRPATAHPLRQRSYIAMAPKLRAMGIIDGQH